MLFQGGATEFLGITKKANLHYVVILFDFACFLSKNTVIIDKKLLHILNQMSTCQESAS